MTVLYLMRHGDAAAQAPADFDRSLTPFGQQQVAASATSLVQSHAAPVSVRASPLVRAQQTARIMADQLALSSPPVSDEMLEGAMPPQRVADHLADDLPPGGPHLLVTHQPLVSRLLHLLTGEEVHMATAAIAIVDAKTIAADSGELRCVI